MTPPLAAGPCLAARQGKAGKAFPVFNNLALIACVALLMTMKIAARAAIQRGDKQRVRVLQFFRIGLSLSACSYGLRVAAVPGSLVSFLSLLCCFAGTLVIWIGWMEHGSLRRRQQNGGMPLEDGEQDDGPLSEAALGADAGLPRLNSSARRVLHHARQEAERQRQCGVDTDHLLLGLLREADNAGARVLARLNAQPECLGAALGQPVRQNYPPHLPLVSGGSSPADALPLTNRACRALDLARQEAHRFDKASVGTDHLLLGLLLMGTGAAAAALLGEGVTVDAVRNEVLQSRVRG